MIILFNTYIYIYINNTILMDHLINNLETCYYDVSSLDE